MIVVEGRKTPYRTGDYHSGHQCSSDFGGTHDFCEAETCKLKESFMKALFPAERSAAEKADELLGDRRFFRWVLNV